LKNSRGRDAARADSSEARWRGALIRHGPVLLVLLAAGLGGCGPRVGGADGLQLPPVGVPGKRSFIVEEAGRGPIVLIFPGRSAPTDDRTLGIRGTALRISEKVEGSVAIFSWKHYPRAREWVRREAAKRRARGEPARLAVVGHSWGGQSAGRFVREALREGLVDRVAVLVTIDAICKGYLRSSLYQLPSILTLEILFPHRLKLTAFRSTPPPDGRRLLRHVNYYQTDSPHLCGAPIATATENHRVLLDSGREPGHGNLDNLVAELVAEDVRRAFLLEPDR
jgi:pimeloyl-ACP methyl ester carboxylesterase